MIMKRRTKISWMTFVWIIINICLCATATAAFTTLLTFDVDGTLVHGSGRAAAESAHARAFNHAVSTLYNDGRPVTPVAKALPRRLYQGSTDGLILIRLAQATCGVSPTQAHQDLDRLMQIMYQYMQNVSDEEICEHIQPLPGVLDQLTTLAAMPDVACGLVTGNVEGIARRKMKAVGIWDTKALSPPCPITQKNPNDKSFSSWPGTDHLSFLGGFGSDYCSGDVENLERNHLDRAQQIAIAMQRCQNVMMQQQQQLQQHSSSKPLSSSSSSKQQGKKQLQRVVHVGDAPADVLAAKALAEQFMQSSLSNENNNNTNNNNHVVVGMVAVATGSYPVHELQELAGEPIPGRWEPVVLAQGMADLQFLQACGL